MSSINSQKIRKFCVWEVMIAIVFKGMINFVPNQKLECFVLYLKIINPFFEKYHMDLTKQIVQGTKQWH